MSGMTSAPSARTTTASPAVLDKCTVSGLTVSLGEEEGTAGTMYRALVFTNTGRRTCTIQGFPRVSFVAADDGRQVGAVAAPAGEEGPPVVLEPGAVAAASLGFTDIGALDPAQCQPTAVRGLRVYPPHSKASVFVPFATTACADATCLSVMTVHAGSGLG